MPRWRWNRMNRGELDGLPPRIARLKQSVVTYIPERCPKCGEPITRDGRRLACRPGGCGWDAFLIDARKTPEEPERVARKTPARSHVDIGEADGLG